MKNEMENEKLFLDIINNIQAFNKNSNISIKEIVRWCLQNESKALAATAENFNLKEEEIVDYFDVENQLELKESFKDTAHPSLAVLKDIHNINISLLPKALLHNAIERMLELNCFDFSVEDADYNLEIRNFVFKEIINMLVTVNINSAHQVDVLTFLVEGFEELKDPSFLEEQADIPPQPISEALKNITNELRGFLESSENNMSETLPGFQSFIVDGTSGEVIASSSSTNGAEDIMQEIVSRITHGLKERNTTDKRTSRTRPKREAANKPNAFPNLEKYGTNLNALAKEGKLKSISCRETETNSLMEVLCRLDCNNPCLLGEPGVGKTAVVENLAVKIANGDVPDAIKDRVIYSISLSDILSGAQYRGSFEGRVTAIAKEAKSDPNIILFIDEIHNIVNSGGGENSVSAGEILKPYLSRGELRCVGATTFNEFNKFISKDTALERRFSPIRIEEPSAEDTLKMLVNRKSVYEKHFNISISDDCLKEIVELCKRYLPNRFFPAKAFDILDDSCAKHALWGKQSSETKTTSLTDNFIKESISTSSGIPLDKVFNKNKERLLETKSILMENVKGQNEAIDTVFKTLIKTTMGFSKENRPLSSFLFSGPTGVGKTETALSLAKGIFGDKDAICRLDMSEYMEKHSVSKLIGAAPGYVGFGDGGKLTNAVKNKPYSIILVDEVEKAHSDVLNIFLQVLDNGFLTDGDGKRVNFRNTIIIFTSNLYKPSTRTKKSIGFSSQETDEKVNHVEEARKAFSDKFSPEFINRIDDIVVFNKLSWESLKDIINLEISRITKIFEKENVTVSVSEEVARYLTNKSSEIGWGARNVKSIAEKELIGNISLAIFESENPVTLANASLIDGKVSITLN